MSDYDRIGQTYAATRRPDPRLGAVLAAALAGTTSVVDVGAGTGSYEPPQTVRAVEPSAVMVRQRPPGSAPSVRARAEALPLADGAVDAAMAVLTVHHWRDLERGLRELRRVARRRVVVLTFDPVVTRGFWLLREYLPHLLERDAEPSLDRVVSALGGASVEPVPVPHDCTDGFAAAYWRRPAAYLDPAVQAGMSVLSPDDRAPVVAGLERLARDVASGAWAQRHADLLAQDELDAGYRLVVADLG